MKKCAKYPTVHFFLGTGFSHFQKYFSTSFLSFKLKCFTLAEIAKLYLQTIPLGILILLPGAEKKSFESVSNLTGHPVYELKLDGTVYQNCQNSKKNFL